MDPTSDDFAAYLQEKINEEIRATYGSKVFERWLRLPYMGPMDHPNGHARLTGGCGDTMEIFLRFHEGRVEKASFLTNGCGASAVCGSLAAEMALGKTPDELLDITGEAILRELEGLPKEEEHCAFLAAETLQEALHDFMMKERGKGLGT